MISNTVKNWLANKLLRNTDFTSPATIYGALILTEPTDDDGTGLVEASYTDYARKAVTFGAPVAGVVTNSLVDYGVAGSTGGTVLGVAFYTAVSGGTFLGYKRLIESVDVASGETVQIPAGSLTWTFSYSS